MTIQDMIGVGVNFDAMAKKTKLPYGMSFAGFDDYVSKFDVSRLPDYDGMIMPYVGHIIFIRPKLYVSVPYNLGTGTPYTYALPSERPDPLKNYVAMANNRMSSFYARDRYGAELLKCMCHDSSSGYMPMLTNRCMSYQTAPVNLKTVDKSTTFYGHTIKYAHYSEEHKQGGTMSIDFRNDAYWSVLKLVYLWMCYIYAVTKNDSVKPSMADQRGGVLDYCGSIIYLVTTMDMSRLIHWEKLTGVFPKSAPFDLFSYEDAPQIDPKITIEFEYGQRSDPNDLEVLYDLNYLTGASMLHRNVGGLGSSTAYAEYFFRNGAGPMRYLATGSMRQASPNSFKAPWSYTNSYAVGPVVMRRADRRGHVNYYLQWAAA